MQAAERPAGAQPGRAAGGGAGLGRAGLGRSSQPLRDRAGHSLPGHSLPQPPQGQQPARLAHPGHGSVKGIPIVRPPGLPFRCTHGQPFHGAGRYREQGLQEAFLKLGTQHKIFRSAKPCSSVGLRIFTSNVLPVFQPSLHLTLSKMHAVCQNNTNNPGKN